MTLWAEESTLHVEMNSMQNFKIDEKLEGSELSNTSEVLATFQYTLEVSVKTKNSEVHLLKNWKLIEKLGQIFFQNNLSYTN